MKLTDEQNKIVNYKLKPRDLIKINAFSGCAKTTTLEHIAKANPDKKFLYVAFSKAIQVEASNRFPKNTECRTGHSLAYSKFGFPYKNKLVASLKAREIATAFKTNDWDLVLNAKKTLDSFLYSSDDTISIEHVDREWRIMMARTHCVNNKIEFDIKKINEYAPCTKILDMANKLWERMRDLNDFEIGMLHDGYFKLWQLSKPKLNYDVILCDEAQDLNPALIDVIGQQTAIKILVGDIHQAIYGWRKAVNAMEKFNPTQEFSLTSSFRFGSSIGKLATMMLYFFKKERREVNGVGSVTKIGELDNREKFTVICRTNAMVFSWAIKLLNSKKIGFVGKVESYRFEDMLDLYYLWSDQTSKIKNKYIKSFDSYEDLKEFSENVEDLDLIWKCRIVEEHQHTIPGYVKEIIEKAVPEERADIVLTTAHKSKGLEFNQVLLTEDYVSLVEQDEKGKVYLAKFTKEELEEVNLFYVAATRAKKALKPNKALQDFLELSGGLDLIDKPDSAKISDDEVSSIVPWDI